MAKPQQADGTYLSGGLIKPIWIHPLEFPSKCASNRYAYPIFLESNL